METKSTNPKDRIGMKKPPLHLIPSAALIHEAEAFRNGAEKYGPFNWRDESVAGTVYISAAMRHILNWMDGEEIAEDSGVHHLAHARACLAIILDAMEISNLVDDRPTAGNSPELIDRLTRKDVTLDYKCASDALKTLRSDFPEIIQQRPLNPIDFNILFDSKTCTFEDVQDFIRRFNEAKEDEVIKVENYIVDNCRFLSATDTDKDVISTAPVKQVYIAGPMRGYPTWNFVAFDRARDYFISEGWDVISPADIDREDWGGDPLTDKDIYAKAVKIWEVVDKEMLNGVIRRDIESILKSDAIALLPGWEKSTGAVAEFFLARWSGAQVLDATTGLPFETLPDLTSILLAVLDYIEDGE